MRSSRYPEITLGPDEALDEFMDGRLRLIQSRSGYRFSIDALLLAEFVTVKPDNIVLDLGTGCGIIPLILLLTRPLRCAIGLEIQRGLALQAARNAVLNGFAGRMEVILGDIRKPPLADRCADVVIANPPYRQLRSGRLNPDASRAIARHEILASFEDVLNAGRRLLKSKGRLAMVVPAARLAEVLDGMRRRRLEPKRLRLLHPDSRSGAKLALVEGIAASRPGLTILPPIMGQKTKVEFGRRKAEENSKCEMRNEKKGRA